MPSKGLWRWGSWCAAPVLEFFDGGTNLWCVFVPSVILLRGIRACWRSCGRWVAGSSSSIHRWRQSSMVSAVPGSGKLGARPTAEGFIYCDSSQSQCAMGFLLASVVLLSASFSGHGFSVDGGGRRWWWSGGEEDPVDLVVIYFLLGSFVQKVGTAVPLCNLRVGSCTCMVRTWVLFIV